LSLLALLVSLSLLLALTPERSLLLRRELTWSCIFMACFSCIESLCCKAANWPLQLMESASGALPSSLHQLLHNAQGLLPIGISPAAHLGFSIGKVSHLTLVPFSCNTRCVLLVAAEEYAKVQRCYKRSILIDDTCHLRCNK
jgi:hypothetical protein